MGVRGAMPHIAAARDQLLLVTTYANTYRVGPTWFRKQLEVIDEALKAAEKQT